MIGSSRLAPRLPRSLASASCSALLCLALCSPAHAGEDDSQALFVVDESLWTLFYDLPSRRFRAVKDAYVRGAFDLIQRDLHVSASYLRIEAERSRIPLALGDAADRLDELGSQFASGERPAHDLDATFADVHWLLAQHFVAQAQQARKEGRHRDAGRYLIAIAHHLERTALWSQAVVDAELIAAVEDLRKQAGKLQRAPANLPPAKAYENRPVQRAVRIIERFGVQLKRKPLIKLSARR